MGNHRNRWHNACYLAGYVVEAGLKAIAEADTKISRNPRSYSHRLPDLLTDLVTNARLSTSYRGVPFDSGKILHSVLYREWNPNARYDPNAWHDSTKSQNFQETATYMVDFLLELRLNGVI